MAARERVANREGIDLPLDASTPGGALLDLAGDKMQELGFVMNKEQREYMKWDGREAAPFLVKFDHLWRLQKLTADRPNYIDALLVQSRGDIDRLSEKEKCKNCQAKPRPAHHKRDKFEEGGPFDVCTSDSVYFGQGCANCIWDAHKNTCCFWEENVKQREEEEKQAARVQAQASSREERLRKRNAREGGA